MYSSYVLLKNFNVVYLYSHLVMTVKLLMAPKDYYIFGNDSLFELPYEIATRIQSTIVMLDDDDYITCI